MALHMGQILWVLGHGQKKKGDDIAVFCEGEQFFVSRCQQGEVEVERDDKNQKKMVDPAYLDGKFFICNDCKERFVDVEKASYKADE